MEQRIARASRSIPSSSSLQGLGTCCWFVANFKTVTENSSRYPRRSSAGECGCNFIIEILSREVRGTSSRESSPHTHVPTLLKVVPSWSVGSCKLHQPTTPGFTWQEAAPLINNTSRLKILIQSIGLCCCSVVWWRVLDRARRRRRRWGPRGLTVDPWEFHTHRATPFSR